MISLSKYLMVKAIASLYHGEVPKPKSDDYQIIVNFSNGDDKQHFINAWKKVKKDVDKYDTSMDNMTIIKNDHGLQATVNVNTI
jgi:hypothetical protein